MNQKYLIHFRAESGVSLYGRKDHQNNPKKAIAFIFDKNEVYIKDFVFEEDGFWLFGGLDIFIKINAKDIETAKIDAKDIVESLLMLLSFTSLSFINRAVIKSIFSVNPDEKGLYPVSFINLKLNPITQTSLTKVDIENFKVVWEAFNKCDRPDRILRAISWLRKGLNTKSIDQFIYFFTGLEVLRKVLEEKLRINNKPPKSYFFRLFSRKKFPGWCGIEKIFEEYLKSNKFKKIRRKRNQILHGFEKLDAKMVKEIDSMLPLVKKSLLTSISVALDLPENLMNEIISQKWAKYNFDRWEVIGGYFKSIESNLKDLILDYPVMSAKTIFSTKRIDLNGEITINEQYSYDFAIPSRFDFEHDWHEVWAEDNSGISKIEVK